MADFLSFKLSDDFLEPYSQKEVSWGFDIGGGNSLSELTFILKYSRKKEDGSKERWWEVCRRCVEGYYSILKDHAKYNRTPWNDQKAQRSAQDAFDRMFKMKWTPPGRGMQHMGTKYIADSRNGSRLINCSFISTEKINIGSTYEATLPFVRLMEMTMNGIGVGIDTRGAGKIVLHQPLQETEVFVVPDTREGWAESLGKLLESFFFKNRKTVEFDYSQVRPEGALLKSFGGTASGPAPLKKMHDKISELLSGREGELITSRDIVDISNLAGKACVAGGSRRSALLSLGYSSDVDYVNIKNWELDENQERMGADGWGHMSNNSIVTKIGEDLSPFVKQIAVNGEPGFIWEDLIQGYGRLIDPKNGVDHRATGTNPCFSGDTLIAVADGRGAVSIAELAETGDDVPVYAIDPSTGLVEIKMGRHPRITGEGKELVEIGFSDGSTLRVTPDHKMVMLDGSTKLAGDLQPNDGVPAFTKRKEYVVKDGDPYWRMYTNALDSTKGKLFEHRLIAKFNDPEKWKSMFVLGEKHGFVNVGGIIVHHKNENTLDNRPENLEMLTPAEHSEHHGVYDNRGANNPMYGREQRESTKNLIGTLAKERWEDPEFRARASAAIAAGHTEESKKKISKARKADWYEYYLEQEASTDLETTWVNGRLHAVKCCEYCDAEMVLGWKDRERCYCSRSCFTTAMMRFERGPRLRPLSEWELNFGGAMADSQHRKDRQREVFANKALEVRSRQIAVYNDLHVELGRKPWAKEWHVRCKELGVPHRFQAKGKTINPNILGGFGELAVAAEESNHRVVSVTKVSGEHTVYNITVDDFHTIGIINRITDKSLHGIYTRQCGEISLEAHEQCNLGEIYPTNHEDIEDLKNTIKHVYMYTKAVSLLPTPWPETNEVIMRNHRIGISMTGVAQFVDTRGWQTMVDWWDEGYRYLSAVDKKYSEWLGVRESIKMTTVKPAGSTSLVAGVTPGVHWPTTNGYHLRRIRFLKMDPLVEILEDAGYEVEPDVMDPEMTVVVTFPVEGIQVRSELEVSVWEKASLAALAQRHWSDNMVSCTLSFRPNEVEQLAPLLNSFQGQLKSASFLPITDDGTVYQQAPYEPSSAEDAIAWMSKIKPIDRDILYGNGNEFIEDKFCTTDVCTI